MPLCPGLTIGFGVLGEVNTRVLNVPESNDAIEAVEVAIQGQSFGPLHYRIRHVTYDYFESHRSNRDLNDIFPLRPPAASGNNNIMFVYGHSI